MSPTSKWAREPSLSLDELTRTASSCAAKPSKTTEWTAPRRAQASIAITAELAVSELALCLDAFSKKQKASSDTVIPDTVIPPTVSPLG
jgi:hypothetical protein